jgi:hypothetical protein
MYVHALHTVRASPDLRVAAGRFRDDVSVDFSKGWRAPHYLKVRRSEKPKGNSEHWNAVSNFTYLFVQIT